VVGDIPVFPPSALRERAGPESGYAEALVGLIERCATGQGYEMLVKGVARAQESGEIMWLVLSGPSEVLGQPL
jgi:hypothetical protein